MPVTLELTTLVALLGVACAAPPLPAPAQPLVPTPDAPFRQARPPLPAVSSEPSPRLPSAESATLSNGLTLWVVRRTELPYVSLALVSREAGTLGGVVPAERVRLTARSVVEGGTVWPDGQIVEPPLINGERVSTRVDPDFSAFTLRVVSANLDEGVTVLGRTVRAPAFGGGNLDDVRLKELKRMQNFSKSLGNGLFEMALVAALGEKAAGPYLGKDMNEVRRASVASLEQCYGALFRPESSALIAVGDVTLTQLLPMAERELSTWKAKLPRAAPPVHEAPRLLSSEPRVHFLPQGDTGQAVVMLLQPAPPSLAEQDELAFSLMADIAVGAVRSRSNLSLRHDAGITYGIEPSILSTRELGLLRIEGAFETGETVRAIDDLQRMLKTLQDEQVTEAELALAKVAMLAELERLTSSNPALSHYFATLFAQGRPPSFLAARPAAVAAVTAVDIQRIARTYLRPQQLEVAVAGPVVLVNTLENVGEVEVYRVSRSTAGTAED